MLMGKQSACHFGQSVDFGHRELWRRGKRPIDAVHLGEAIHKMAPESVPSRTGAHRRAHTATFRIATE